MIRIKDIAKEANVSEGTVDRVIHNRGGVSKITEEKIKKIIKDNNFNLNPIASALAMQSKYNIAVLIPEYSDADIFWKSPYLGILKGIEEIKNLGIKVNCFKFDQYNPNSYKNSFKELLKTNPSGIIFVPLFFKETNQIINQLRKLKIKYMFLNVDIERFKNTIFIGQDSYTAGYIAGKLMHLCLPEKSTFLIIQSRHNITDNNAISKRIEGFKDYFIRNNIKNETLNLKIENLNDSKDNRQKINSYLKLHKSINGIFVPSSRISTIVDCLIDIYLKRVQMIGFDNTPQNIDCLKNNSISFLISQKSFDQGYESIRIMKDLLLKKKLPENKIYFPIDILTKENVMFNERNQFEFENEISNDKITVKLK
ncbi:substrate-binding domain-containing protein [Gaetbulibacter sp. M235]|uniref:substrate-binding domain-containing protein n=1 Tax=Gaetbulibacter sp. M235 TaxID=3126510 RepID=UPI00374EF207